MFRSLLFTLLFFSFVNSGCDSAKEKKEIQKSYFDLPAFFKKEIKLLMELNPGIEKKINKDGETETKILESVDWKKELAPFVDIDINKPSWIRSFSVDTLFLTSKNFEINCVSLEEGIPIKQVKLLFENNSCSFVQINKKSENNLFSSFQELVYKTGEGYRINGYQKVKFAFDTRYEIITDFIIN